MSTLPAIEPVPIRTRVLLADQPGFSRTVLARVLKETPGVTLTEVMTDGSELRDALEELRPDVLVIDDRLLRDGHVLPRQEGLRVIVVGVDDDPAYAVRAERLGAVAWVAKERADLILAGVFETT